MAAKTSIDTYVSFLKEQGCYVLKVDGIYWYEHSGFMAPAYLTHCYPKISEEMAEQVVRISGRPFARWTSEFGKAQDTLWWYVLRRGTWAIEDVRDKKKRWMIRQGKKRFSTRLLTSDEVVNKCPKVTQLATERYKGGAEVESQKELEKRVIAGQKISGVLEYIGCFHKDTLVSFSENYIQGNAVWLVNIRHDPTFLNKYSSYALLDGILDYYLNKKKMDYVLDGWRSTHHRTHFQEHLIRVFGFKKEYGSLNIKYSRRFGIIVRMAYPFRNLVLALCRRIQNNTLDNIGATLRQEHIRRSCKHL